MVEIRKRSHQRDRDNEDKNQKRNRGNEGRSQKRDRDNEGKSQKRDRDNEGKNQKRDRENEGKNQKRRPSNKGSSDEGELVVYRILCPGRLIGSVIGKGGKVINSLRQETGAWIKVVDPFPGAEKRVITVYCHVKNKDSMDVDEDDSEPLCSAQEALLKLHETIMNISANDEDSDGNSEEEVEMLVPRSQVANIIGKAGANIRKLRAKTKANIKVDSKDPSNVAHSLAMSFDSFVLISGDAEAVKRALFSVSAIMYKFSPKEEISLDTTIPELPPTPSVIIRSDVPVYPSGSFYPSVDVLVHPHSSVPPVLGATPQPLELYGYTDHSGARPMYPSSLPVVSGHSNSSRSGELVMRVLCPSDRIGLVIGRGGSSIRSIRQVSGASVEADNPQGNAKECLITVTSVESTEDAKSAAVEAILLLQGKINDEDDDTVNIRLLVASKVLGCLIGKNGSVISDMRKRTKAHIYISKGDKPKTVASDDELVEVKGESGEVRDALVQITLRLRDYILRDKDGNRSDYGPHFETVYSTSHSVPQVLPSVAPGTPFGYDQMVETRSGLGMLSGSSLYGHGSLQAGDDGYGSLLAYSTKAYGGLPSSVEIVIPIHALTKVVGKGGANLVNIQKISGADVEIVDSKTSHFERIARVSGTSEQKHAAQNLIQAFILAT